MIQLLDITIDFILPIIGGMEFAFTPSKEKYPKTITAKLWRDPDSVGYKAKAKVRVGISSFLTDSNLILALRYYVKTSRSVCLAVRSGNEFR